MENENEDFGDDGAMVHNQKYKFKDSSSKANKLLSRLN